MLDEDIEHITILIYRAPEVLAFALYLYEDLVQVRCVAQPAQSMLEPARAYSEPNLMHQSRIGFVGNRDTALGQEVFHIEKAHTESMVQPADHTAQ